MFKTYIYIYKSVVLLTRCVRIWQINSSFANMDPFGTGQTLPPLQLPQNATTNATITPLKKPPRWIRRPVGASFAVSFTSFTLNIINVLVECSC